MSPRPRCGSRPSGVGPPDRGTGCTGLAVHHRDALADPANLSEPGGGGLEPGSGSDLLGTKGDEADRSIPPAELVGASQDNAWLAGLDRVDSPEGELFSLHAWVDESMRITASPEASPLAGRAKAKQVPDVVAGSVGAARDGNPRWLDAIRQVVTEIDITLR